MDRLVKDRQPGVLAECGQQVGDAGVAVDPGSGLADAVDDSFGGRLVGVGEDVIGRGIGSHRGLRDRAGGWGGCFFIISRRATGSRKNDGVRASCACIGAGLGEAGGE